MDIGLIAVRYARALLKAAIADHCHEEVYHNMSNLLECYLSVPELRPTTAVQLSAEVEQRMRRLVEERTQGNVEFTTEVDPAILGGFVLDYDTYRMDASVKSKLNRILIELKNK